MRPSIALDTPSIVDGMSTHTGTHTTAQAWRAEQRDHSMADAHAQLFAAPRAASGPDRLELLAEGIAHAERAVEMEVAIARGLGVTWQEIGASLRMSRQAAQQRFGT